MISELFHKTGNYLQMMQTILALSKIIESVKKWTKIKWTKNQNQIYFFIFFWLNFQTARNE